MKSSLALSIALPLLAAGVLSLSGCGQPGPLYMPKMPPRPGGAKPVDTTAPATPATIQGAPPDTLPGATPDLTLPAPSPTSPVLPH